MELVVLMDSVILLTISVAIIFLIMFVLLKFKTIRQKERKLRV